MWSREMMFFLKHACKKKKIALTELVCEGASVIPRWMERFFLARFCRWSHWSLKTCTCSCSISLQIRNWSLCWYRGGWRWGGVGWGVPAGFPPAPRTCFSGSRVFPFRFLFNAGGFHSEFSPTSPYASFPPDGANKEAIAPIINLRESLLTRPRQKRNVCPDDGR